MKDYVAKCITLIQEMIVFFKHNEVLEKNLKFLFELIVLGSAYIIEP